MAMALGVSATAFAANPFSDLPAGHWAYGAVAKLAAAGVVDGYPDGTFKGDKTMTRYEMAQIVAKALAKGAIGADDKLVSEFADQFVISTDGPFGQSLGHDLGHFVPGHGLIALEGPIRIAIDDAGSRQFGYGAVGPVASRQIREGVGRKSGSADAQCHSHSKYQRFFHWRFLPEFIFIQAVPAPSFPSRESPCFLCSKKSVPVPDRDKASVNSLLSFINLPHSVYKRNGTWLGLVYKENIV